MNIKLVAIDVDDTLLDSENKMTTKTIVILKKAIKNGIKIVMASGRPLTGTQEIYQELGIDNKNNQYAMNFNGGLISSTSGEILVQDTLSIIEAQKLYKIAKNLGVYLQLETNNCVYTPYTQIPVYTLIDGQVMNTPVKRLNLEKLKKTDHFAKAMFVGDPERINKAYKLPQLIKFYNIKASSPSYLEINHKGISKSYGLKELAKKLSLNINQTMAIGDGENDIPMIKTAGIGVAMANGTDEIKKQADFITRSNDEDGVALAVKKFI